MNASNDTKADDQASTEQEMAKQAYEAIKTALRDIDLPHNPDLYISVQSALFDAKARLRALDPEWPPINIEGRRVAVSRGTARVLDGLQVCDPKNPHTTHAVTVDHVIDGDGSVTCEINAVPLDQVGREQGSHIR